MQTRIWHGLQSSANSKNISLISCGFSTLPPMPPILIPVLSPFTLSQWWPHRKRKMHFTYFKVKKAPLPNWDLFRETPPSLGKFFPWKEKKVAGVHTHCWEIFRHSKILRKNNLEQKFLCRHWLRGQKWALHPPGKAHKGIFAQNIWARFATTLNLSFVCTISNFKNLPLQKMCLGACLYHLLRCCACREHNF